MSEEQGKISPRFCIFCCKTVAGNKKLNGRFPPQLSQSLLAKNVGKEDNLKWFFTFLQRYLKTDNSPNGVSRQLSLADGSNNDFGGMECLGVDSCQLCGTLLNSFCELYHKMKCLELQIQWKTQTLLRIMKEAGRVPSRMKALKEGLVTEEMGKNFIEFRQKTIRMCSNGLSQLPPRVRLENINTTGMTFSTKQKPEIDVQIMQSWILSFTAVVLLLLSPNSTGTAQCDARPAFLETELDLFVDDSDNLATHQDLHISSNDVAHIPASPYKENSDCSESLGTTLKPDPDPLAFLKSCRESDEDADDDDLITDAELASTDAHCLEVPEMKAPLVVEYTSQAQQQAVIEELKFCDETVFETKTFNTENKPTEIRQKKIREKKTFACSACSKIYTLRSLLNQHVRNQHSEMGRWPQQFGPFVCKICNKGFANHGIYINHRNSLMHRLRLRRQNSGGVDDTIRNKQVFSHVPKGMSEINNEATTDNPTAIINGDKLPAGAEERSENENGTTARYNLRTKRPTNKKSRIAGADKSASYEDTDSDSESSSSLEEFSSASSATSSIDSDDDSEKEAIRSRVKVEAEQRASRKRNRSAPDGWKYCRLEGCSYVTPDLTAYEDHKRLHEPGNYPCKFCDTVQTNVIKLSAHELKKHFGKARGRRKDVFNCPRCPYSAVQRLFYVNHFARFHLGFSRRGYEPCPICHLNILKSKQSNHFRANHGAKNVDRAKIWKCEEKDCGAYFTNSKRALREHKCEVHDVREGTCPAFGCRKRFTDVQLLQKHIKLHDEFKCHFCDTVKHYAPDLALHELEHTRKPGLKFKCSRCPFRSAISALYVTHHLETHLQLTDRLYTCNICSRKFRIRQSLSDHFKSHHLLANIEPSAVKKCDHCPAYFLLDTQLQIHKGTCPQKSSVDENPAATPLPARKKPRGSYKCRIANCEELFQSAEDRVAHGKLHGSFKCQFCPVTLQYAFDLATHEMRNHANGDEQNGNAEKGPYQCSRCPLKPPSLGVYNIHFVERHLQLNARVHTCSICNAPTTSLAAVQRHKREWHKTKGVEPDTIQKCDQCPAYFLQRGQLIQHKRTIHDGSSLYCAECDKTYKSIQSLTKHRYNVHGIGKSDDSFPFPCDLSSECNARFKTIDELEWHKKYHSTQHMRKLAPDMLRCEKCGKECKGENGLRTHMTAIHKKNRPTDFKCDQCEKVFSSKGGLKQHQLYHQGPDKWEFMCSVCSKKCIDKHTLKAHMNTHTKTKPFVCQVCGEKYAHRHNLRNHVNTKHKDEGVQDIAKKMNRKNVVSRKGKKLGTGFCLTSGVQGQSSSLNEDSE